MIIYEYDDGWNQTAADDSLWLATFKQRHMQSGSAAGSLLGNFQPPTAPAPATMWCQSVAASSTRSGGSTSPVHSNSSGAPSSGAHKSSGRYYLNDANCYMRLARELKKWIASTMSPNNPNCHVPTDEELQHQARWIVYEE
jgi:hypothetical protein